MITYGFVLARQLSFFTVSDVSPNIVKNGTFLRDASQSRENQPEF